MKLKITVWNSQMAFRKKAMHIQNLHPDILVVPECEDLDKLALPEDFHSPTSKLWCGDNPHKGLGVFSFGEYHLHRLEHNPEFKNILPIAVTGPVNFTLLPVTAEFEIEDLNLNKGQSA